MGGDIVSFSCAFSTSVLWVANIITAHNTPSYFQKFSSHQGVTSTLMINQQTFFLLFSGGSSSPPTSPLFSVSPQLFLLSSGTYMSILHELLVSINYIISRTLQHLTDGWISCFGIFNFLSRLIFAAMKNSWNELFRFSHSVRICYTRGWGYWKGSAVNCVDKSWLPFL